MSADEIFYVTDEEHTRLENSYALSTAEMKTAVKELRQWLRSQPHLPQHPDDTFLETMLKMNKCSVQKTKDRIDGYFTARNTVPQFYADRSPLVEDLQNFLDTLMVVPLPRLTADLQRVYVVRFADARPERWDLGANARLLLDLWDVRLRYDRAAPAGEVYIYDLRDLRLGHVLKVQPGTVRDIYAVMQRAYADRIKGIHFLNMPLAGHALIGIAKMVLSEKLASRVHSHRDLESLYRCVPAALLPEEYNGAQNSLFAIYDEWRKFLEGQSEWLVKIGNRRTDEALRPLNSTGGFN